MEARRPAPLSLPSLPAEIIGEVCGYLDNFDIKNVRLTGTSLAAWELHFSRVFLSPNPRNIEVFLAVADHDVYCRRVSEIIVDDALLAPAGFAIEGRGVRLCLKPVAPATAFREEDDDDWFDEVCRHRIIEVMNAKCPDVPGVGSRIRPFDRKETRRIYARLLQQQKRVLGSGDFDAALETGLVKFSALRRITITAATHGLAFNPFHQTPMIRQLPRDMNYPTWDGWLTSRREVGDEITRDIGLGLHAVIGALARNKDGGKVTELVVGETQHLNGAKGFDLANLPSWQPEILMNKLEAVLARSTMKRVHFDLDSDTLYDGNEEEHERYRSRTIRRILEGAGGGQGLESVTLRGAAAAGLVIPSLRQTLRPQAMARIRHLGLVNLIVTDEDDLVAFLASLPPTLRTLDLSRLSGGNRNFNTYRFLMRMRDELGWAAREHRPRVRFGEQFSKGEFLMGYFLDIDEEINAFLYDGAPCPFEKWTATHVYVQPGVGVEKKVHGELYLPLDGEDESMDSGGVETERHQGLILG